MTEILFQSSAHKKEENITSFVSLRFFSFYNSQLSTYLCTCKSLQKCKQTTLPKSGHQPVAAANLPPLKSSQRLLMVNAPHYLFNVLGSEGRTQLYILICLQ